MVAQRVFECRPRVGVHQIIPVKAYSCCVNDVGAVPGLSCFVEKDFVFVAFV